MVLAYSAHGAALTKNINKYSESLNLKNPTYTSKHKVIKTAKKYLGVRYKYGASTKTTKKFDCSSFVKHVYKKNGKTLPRTSRTQAKMGKHIKKKNLKRGDLVFFGTKKRINHVGIYIGGNKFIHASSGAKKVTISKLSKDYYKKHYRGARRV